MLFSMTVFAGSISFVISTWNMKRLLNLQSEKYNNEISRRFENFKESDTKALLAALNIFLANQEIKNVFLQHDRQLLYETTLPIFEKMNADYGITHMYFHDTDGYNFLRMQDPEMYGDKIDRQSFKDAMETKNVGVGLELGKNIFALRVVRPYYQGDNLIGYVEFSKEIDNFFKNFETETGDNFTLFGKKDFLNREDWKLVRSKHGLSDNWDDLTDNVQIYPNNNSVINYCLDGNSLDNYQKNQAFKKKVAAQGKQMECSGFNIRDKQNAIIATVVISHDVTWMTSQENNAFNLETMGLILLFMVFSLIVYIMISLLIIKPVQCFINSSKLIASGKLDTFVAHQQGNEMNELAFFFNSMVEKLRMSQETLIKKSNLLKSKMDQLTQKNHQLDKTENSLKKSLKEIRQSQQKTKQLVQELDKFKLVVDNASDFVAIANANGEIIYVNKATEKISGYSAQEILNSKNGLEYLWGGAADGSFIRELLKTIGVEKRSFVGEVRNKNKNRREYDVNISITPILDEQGNILFFVSIGRDITKEKQIERAQTSFISLASHQLRTPLTSIKWLIELLLKKKTGRLNKDQQEFLTAAHESTKRLVLLIKDFLNISQIEAGKIILNSVPTNILDLVSDVVKEVSPQIEEKSLVLKQKFEDDLPSVNIDKLLIRQVILNLISNSIKYTPDHGTIIISVGVEKNLMKISVTDTGIGIPKQEQDRLFERFFRASNAQIATATGTGLGLYLAKLIVNISGGSIGIDSSQKTGTKAWFALPI